MNKNFPTVDPAQQSWQLPDTGIQWRAMNAAKALTALGARHRLSDNGSGASASFYMATYTVIFTIIVKDDAAWDAITKAHEQPFGLFAPFMHTGQYYDEGW